MELHVRSLRGPLFLLSDASTAHPKVGVVLTYYTSEVLLFLYKSLMLNLRWFLWEERHFYFTYQDHWLFSLSILTFSLITGELFPVSLEPPSFFWLLPFLWPTEYYNHLTFDKFQIQCFGKERLDFSYLDVFLCKNKCLFLTEKPTS